MRPLRLFWKDLSCISSPLPYNWRDSFLLFWRRRGRRIVRRVWMSLRNYRGRYRSVRSVFLRCVWWSLWGSCRPWRICISRIRPRRGGPRSLSCPCVSWSSVWGHSYGIEDEVCGDVWSLVFGDDALLEPSDWLPPFELYHHLVCDDVLEEVQEDLPLHCVACEVERFVDRDERWCHLRNKDLSYITMGIIYGESEMKK